MIALTVTARRERTARRVLHNAICRSGRFCRGDNEHAFRAYRDIGAAVAAAPDRATLLAILHQQSCAATRAPLTMPRGCQDSAAHLAALAAQPHVRKLFAALLVR